MLKKITQTLLIALILSLGFGQLLRFELFSVPVYLHDILVICILFIQGMTCDWRSVLKRNSWLQAKKGSLASKKADLMGTNAIMVFLLGLAISWVYALTQYSLVELLVPALYTLRILTYLGLFVSLKQSKITVPSSIFLFSGLVTLMIGLAQYVFLPDMRMFQYLGWDDHLNRLTLPHFDPTFTGVMISLSLLAFAPTKSSILYPVFSLLAILLTYSRSVWLSLLLTGVFSIKNKKILLVSIILLLVSIFALPRKFGEGTNLLRTYSITSRIESDMSYIQKYQWDLLIGRGMNTLILDTPSGKYDNHATGPNNSYLYLLATTGLLGLIGWGMFMYSLHIKSSHKSMLVFFFIASLFNNVMFYPFALLWVLIVESQSNT